VVIVHRDRAVIAPKSRCDCAPRSRWFRQVMRPGQRKACSLDVRSPVLLVQARPVQTNLSTATSRSRAVTPFPVGLPDIQAAGYDRQDNAALVIRWTHEIPCSPRWSSST
jgi:hypothetical protein